MLRLLAHDLAPDQAVIEASGISEPQGIAETLFQPDLEHLVRIVKPPSTLPMYLALARDMAPDRRALMARRACLYCFGILVTSLFAGGLILRAFGISYGALRVAGGLVVLILGHGLMYDKGPTHPIDRQPQPPANPTFFPLAMPGITGPGTIAVVIGISTEMRELTSFANLALAHAPARQGSQAAHRAAVALNSQADQGPIIGWPLWASSTWASVS